MKRPKILVVGSFMMDMTVSAPRVPDLGETVTGTKFSTAPGGKGFNQAVQCARLGADVTMVGCLGNDTNGEEFIRVAKDIGLDIEHVKISDTEHTGVASIQLEVKDDSVQNRIIIVPGSNYALTPEDLGWLEGTIWDYDIVMLQLEISMETNKYVAEVANKAGVKVMLNPAPAAELDSDFLSNVTYLSPNEFEAALLSGHKIKVDENGADEDDAQEAARKLMELGASKVIITLGENGSLLCDPDKCVRVPSILADNVADPTAAGDSFVGAFCTAQAMGMTEEEALEYASYTACITVQGLGAMPSLPDKERVDAFFESKK